MRTTDRPKLNIVRGQKMHERYGAILVTSDMCVMCMRDFGGNPELHRVQIFDGKIVFEGLSYQRIICNVCIECPKDSTAADVRKNIQDILDSHHCFLTI